MKLLQPISFPIFSATALCVALFIFPANGQTTFCPENIDFEQGNLGRWEFYTGSCCPINAPTPGIVVNRHTLTSGTGVDPIAGFPVVAPGGGQFSFKLGNAVNGAQAERARYFINVPSSVSGNFILSYRYAVVFEDPRHAPAQQPRFEIRAYDSATNIPLPCNQYTYVSSSNIPGFMQVGTSSVFYLPWTTGTINLSDYKGKTIILDFRNGDCSLGGHYGYSYIDMNCGLFNISPTICDTSKTDITLNAPPGYQSYEWRDSALTTVLGTTQDLTVPMPAGPTIFAVILTPYPGFGCKDTLYTIYTAPKTSNINATYSADTAICEFDKTSMHVSATGPDGPYIYQWTPATGLNCTNCPSPTVTGVKTTTYHVKVTNTLGCSVTDSIHVIVDTVEKPMLTPVKDSICQRDSVIVGNANTKHRLNNGHQWVVSPATILAGGGTDSFVKLHWPAPGLHAVLLTGSKGLCSYTDTARVYVKPDFTFTMPGNDTICTGQQISLATSANSGYPLTYNWQPSTGLSCDDCPAPLASPTTTTFYKLRLNNIFGCADSGVVRVQVDTTTESKIRPDDDSVCLNHGFGIANIGNNPVVASHIWSVDTGNITYGNGTDSIHVFWNLPGYKRIFLKTSQGICTSADSLTVYVINYPRASFEVSSDGCIGKPVSLFPVSVDAAYHWQIDGQNIDDSLFERLDMAWNAAGVYKIKLTLTYAKCTSAYEKDVTIHSPPIAEIIADNREDICKGKEFTLRATSGDRYTYAWEPSLSFNSNNTPEVTARAERPQSYFLQVINQWGCSSRDSVFIDAPPCCEIIFPNAFTPDGNGRNDIFRPVNREDKKIVDFMIANRRGQVVFKNADDKGWDGTHNGQPAAQDTYNYYIRYICNGEEAIQKGTLILMR